MKKKFNKIALAILPSGLRSFLRKLKLGYRMVSSEKSYLVQTGYVYSSLDSKLTDQNNEYIPWMNYPFIAFLEERLSKDLVVFEFGSGASTIFFAKKVKKVDSVEYDKEWYEKIKTILSNEVDNAKIHYVALDDSYPQSMTKYSNNEKCDIVVVDGRERVKCAMAAFDHLSDIGVIILDDSHRDRYKEAIDFYKGKGFKTLTFKGIKPTGLGIEHSMVLYRENNCLGV